MHFIRAVSGGEEKQHLLRQTEKLRLSQWVYLRLYRLQLFFLPAARCYFYVRRVVSFYSLNRAVAKGSRL